MPTPFEALQQVHRPFVTRLARYFTRGDRDLAQDLSQEAWIALWRIPEERQTDVPYVHTVLRRAMFHRLRRERAHRVVTLEQRPVQRRPLRSDVLQFRRNTPRHHVEAIVPLRTSMDHPAT